MKHAAATLGSGNLRQAVVLPDGEDLNEWVAVNSMILRIFFDLLGFFHVSCTNGFDYFFSPHSVKILNDFSSFPLLRNNVCCNLGNAGAYLKPKRKAGF
jgi:hypothetical protein